MVIGDRLDVDAGPAVVIKRLGDGVVDGIVGANVDVEAVFDVSEGAPQADVFEVLCVGNERHESRPVFVFIVNGRSGGALFACIARVAVGAQMPAGVVPYSAVMSFSRIAYAQRA